MPSGSLRITSLFRIKGRGLVVVVAATGVPLGALRIGCLVHQGDQSWKITGVEMGGTPSTVGLVLSPMDPEPDVLSPLEL